MAWPVRRALPACWRAAPSGGVRAVGWAVAGFLCQTGMLVLGFHRALPGGLSLGAYLQLMAWFVVLCGIAAWGKLKQEVPLVFAAPLGLMLFAMSAPYLGP